MISRIERPLEIRSELDNHSTDATNAIEIIFQFSFPVSHIFHDKQKKKRIFRPKTQKSPVVTAHTSAVEFQLIFVRLVRVSLSVEQDIHLKRDSARTCAAVVVSLFFFTPLAIAQRLWPFFCAVWSTLKRNTFSSWTLRWTLYFAKCSRAAGPRVCVRLGECAFDVRVAIAGNVLWPELRLRLSQSATTTLILRHSGRTSRVVADRAIREQQSRPAQRQRRSANAVNKNMYSQCMRTNGT